MMRAEAGARGHAALGDVGLRALLLCRFHRLPSHNDAPLMLYSHPAVLPALRSSRQRHASESYDITPLMRVYAKGERLRVIRYYHHISRRCVLRHGPFLILCPPPRLQVVEAAVVRVLLFMMI